MPFEKEPNIPKECLYSSKEFSLCDLYDWIKKKKKKHAEDLLRI